MKPFKIAIAIVLLTTSFLSFAQENPQKSKAKVTGKVVEKISKQPLEYATVTFFLPNNPKPMAGGITDSKGEFSIDVTPGTYNIQAEFISFQINELKSKSITGATNLGTIELAEDAMQLNEVIVRAENTTVEIKLDKKVYNVGNDLLVKGGTVSDVLDNIPSVTVDSDGTIALRGNENVRVLIDGRPSNAINISEALRLIPADAIDKVEVVTNPSARYDSEGGGGLLNIILKKGKNQGTNGTIIANAGDPETYGLSGNINYKTEEINLFTTTGYNYRTNPGNAVTNTEYLDVNGLPTSYTNERRTNDRLNKGYNSNFGMDWYLDKSTTWTNSINLRKYDGSNPETVYFDNYDQNYDFLSASKRFNDQRSNSTNFEYATNFVKKFKKDGHKLTVDAAFSQNRDNDTSQINDGLETTDNKQKQGRNTVQANYVLPLGKESKSQFEAGYKGDFNTLHTDYKVNTFNTNTGLYEPNTFYTNILEYKEKINAVYTQFGTKINKFSVLLGMRYEHSNIDINQYITSDFNNKQYGFLSPSAFLTYEVSDNSNVSLSYSRRISRPRGRMINPFSNYSSNINIFQGNPDLDPAISDAFDIGFLKKWDKVTLSTSMYLNHTKSSFEFIRKESGDFVITPNGGEDDINDQGEVITVVDGPDLITPVLLTTPINLATEYRFGFEFTLNYNPFKWWKLNSNFNFYQIDKTGSYTYTDFQNQIVTQNFDNTAYSWFTRVTSKVNLPYKIDWQTNLTYNGPQQSVQSKSRGQFGANLGFSKDILKDKATIALNVQDVFNSRKRIYETELARQNSYSEMQWRVRSVNVSFTYRFNKKKTDREKPVRGGDDGGMDDFQG